MNIFFIFVLCNFWVTSKTASLQPRKLLIIFRIQGGNNHFKVSTTKTPQPFELRNPEGEPASDQRQDRLPPAGTGTQHGFLSFLHRSN